MINETVMEGPTVEEALDAALEEMGVQQDAVEFEVLDEPSKGLFGSSGKPARVRVWLKPGVQLQSPDEDEEEVEDGDVVPPTSEPQTQATGPTPLPELTDEQLDAIADAGAATIQEIMARLGIEASVEEYEGDEGEIILDIVGDDLGILIGRHGRTLDALQILVSAITNRRLDQRYPVVVDVSGYRHRRRVKLEDIARRAADRAARQHRLVQLRPMTSFERRVVHVVLRDDRRVRTESEGDEPRRMVVIHPR
ncbi:MAG: RNA-binding cell elongation regulator Jag/EloR [Coriobacteriia bacterium]|nr:RNA-binding cell elongation regulator Jag/EloR [Coriobacteriia bacterium]